MRCDKCSKLRSDDVYLGHSECQWDSVPAFKASAEAGCDLCVLFWTACKQDNSEKSMANLLQGLNYDGKQVSDAAVWLEGLVYPKRQRMFFDKHTADTVPNAIFLKLGLLGPSIGRLVIFADPGTPAASLFYETWITVDRNPKAHIDFVRSWMHECKARHRICSTSFFGDGPRSEMPTRLIDVSGPRGTGPARLVATGPAGIRDPYLALSYCWGANEQPITLREDNIRELESHIYEDILPKTYKEMFQIAHDLGFRYVWIDALCIIQGNRDDWTHESRRMAHVYGGAALTIIAGRAVNSHEGFLENGFRPTLEPCAIPFYHEETKEKLAAKGETGDMGNLWLSLPRSYDEGPVSKRGWCFQEAMLSRRALLFGKEQIRFHCQELEVWEDGSMRRSPPYRIRYGLDTMYNPAGPDLNNSKPTDTAQDPQDVRKEQLARRWLFFWYTEVLPFYCTKRITDPTDIFAAISSIAQVVKSKIGSRYIGGIWEADMVRGLLWKPMQKRSSFLFPAERRPAGAPSWSWAAIRCRISVDTPQRNEIRYHESNWLVRPKYQGRWAPDTICHATEVRIPSYQLEFFGRPRRVRCLRSMRGNTWRGLVWGHCITLLPIPEDETDQVIGSDHAPGDLDRVVADGTIDVTEEMVSDCWCLPLTKREGLVLVRNRQDKFRRIGYMMVQDLGWMMSAREEEVCLI